MPPIYCAEVMLSREWWVPSNGDRLPQAGAIVNLLGNISQQVLGVFAQGKAGRSSPVGMAPSPCPSSRKSPTLPLHLGLPRSQRSPTSGLPAPPHPFLGPGPQLGVDKAI